MKKILALSATLLLAIGAHAQAIYNPGEHNNTVTVIAKDANADLDNFPIEIHLSNPETSIGSISTYLYFDDNSVRPWIWDEDEESYTYDTNTKRCYKSATVNIWLADEDNPKFPGYFYVNVLDSKDFKLNEGNVITVYIDATKLSDGTHILHVVEPMCSYASSDGSESATYFCTPHNLEFNVSGGTLTVVDGINSIYPPIPEYPHYDLQGRPELNNRWSGERTGIHIVGGKKIIK